jgi:pimeloyl-ACP methyl ester carboxylesterase
MDRRHYLKLTLGVGLLATLGACGGSEGESITGEAPMFKQRSVTTADGVRLNVVEAGNPAGPAIVFVHGISQSWLSWIAQLADDGLRAKYRLVAFDLRGHGASEGSNVALDAHGKPRALLPDAKYNDGNAASTSALWAGDLAAVLSGLELKAPLVVGWSYGGAVVADYIATRNGLGAIGKAIFLATSPVVLPPGTADGGADTVFSAATLGALVGTTSVNPMTGLPNTHAQIAAGLSSFVELCFADGTARDAAGAAEIQGVSGFNLFTPANVRLDVIGRAFDHRAALAALTAADKARLRVIAPQGDAVLQPARIQAYWEATGLAYGAIAAEGHLYHHRNAVRFNADLAAFAG